MKQTAIFAIALVAAFFSRAGELTLEDISPPLSADAPIIWQAPTNHLPSSMWVYKKQPHVFSAATISNAVVLASFQKKGFPKPSTKQIVIWADRSEGEPMPPYLSISSEEGSISYNLGDRAPDSPESILKGAATVERAWECVVKLGIDRKQLIKTNVVTQGGRGVFFSRQIDGVLFYDNLQGFSFQEFGPQRKIREFSITLPDLKRKKNIPIASTQQIIDCIRAHKTPVVPPQNEEFNYFDRVKTLANAKRLTITKITPYYSEGIFGQMPTNNEVSKYVMPFAELEAVANLGSSNVTIRLMSPIISSEVTRLLAGKSK